MTTVIQKEKQVDPLWSIKKSYWVGAIWSIGIVLSGLFISSLINRFSPLNDTVIIFLQAFSVVPGSAALFGVRGWDIQTWNGKTPPELLNQKIFKRISIIGLFLPVVAFSLVTNEFSPQMEARILQKLKAEILQELLIQNTDSSQQPSALKNKDHYVVQELEFSGDSLEKIQDKTHK